MTIRTVLLAAAAAAVLGGAAFGLEGAYESNGVTITFAADTYTVDVPAANVKIDSAYKVEGDKITVKTTGEDTFCMGAEGVYTIAQTDKNITLTTVSDPCAQRSQTMAATWTKK